MLLKEVMMVDVSTTQANLDLTITTTLGNDALLVDVLEGIEQLSTPFEFILRLRGSSNAIDLSSLINTEMTVELSLGGSKRYFSGIVGEMSQGSTPTATDLFETYYQAKLYPTFWLLKFNCDHRIFQNKSAMTIIKALFSENGLTNFSDKTTSKGQGVREYCVQYGESVFDFISRLMEEEGIFYFFEYSSSGHTLVLADSNDTFTPQTNSAVTLIQSLVQEPEPNKILFCSLHYQVVPKSFSTGDYNYSVSTTPFKSTATGVGNGGEVRRYPGRYTTNGDGDTVSSLRIQALEWPKETLQGNSTVSNMTPGYKFTLSTHLRTDMNKEYVAYRVSHKLNMQEEGASYENTFIAFDSTVTFTPPVITPKPRIHSTQTAKVVGKSGEEITTDEYGRVVVLFHWDRLGPGDETTTCMIRVSQAWAMSQWGFLFTPRIGQEVVVSFVDGDPDRPLITGCVYNCDHLPPYLPDEPTKSTIKTNTSKGGGGFNEIRFEDKKDSEQIYVHAQKDMDRVVENARTLKINKGDDTETIVKGSRLITLEASGDSPPTHTLTLNKGDDIIHLKQGNLTITLDKGDETRNITGKQSSTVSDAYTITAKTITLKCSGDFLIDAGGKVTIKSGDAMDIESGAAMTVKSGSSAAISSSTSMDIKSGTAATVTGGTSITVKGSTGATVDGGPNLQLTSSASATLSGSASLSVKGGTVSISGPMISIG